MHGFQLWVNLPRDHKMISPRYQEIPSSKIPLGQSSDGKVRVRVIAGESLGARAVIETQTPILYLHFTLESGAQFTQEVAESYNLFAYVVNGEGQFGPDNRRAERGQIVLFNSDGGQVQIKATGKEKLELLLIGGTPINEPVVRYGPFVMNTEEEIYTAINDYRTGKLGSINF
jgi:quercetin 2,3-dioxygenase